MYTRAFAEREIMFRKLLFALVAAGGLLLPTGDASAYWGRYRGGYYGGGYGGGYYGGYYGPRYGRRFYGGGYYAPRYYAPSYYPNAYVYPPTYYYY